MGTLGGTNGQAIWINDNGEVVGEADLPGDQVHDAFLWKKGVMTDLGNLGQTSFAFCINSKSQVVGHSLTGDGSFHAFLWENDGPMIDLNSSLPSGSSLLLTDAFNINDRGEIAGVGLPAGCTDLDACGHLYLLIPRDGNPGAQEQEERDGDKTPITQSDPTLFLQAGPAAIRSRPRPRDGMVSLRDRLSRRYRLPGESAGRPR
jgi:probable HAF family extracellular repeat protein